jgi:16S rRNA (guanine527-N7)-methyltransferase
MENIRAQIASGMASMGIETSESAMDLMATHAERVLSKNQVMNLTSVAEADFVPLHILDSMSALEELLREPDGLFADLGSGAGYPGIPLSIVTGRRVALVESVRKKAAFLEELSRDLRLEATVHPIRAEELAQTHQEFFRVAIARAVSALPSLVELAAPLLCDAGALICLKGHPGQEEFDRGDTAAALCGLKRESVRVLHVPRVEADRTIVVYRKTGEAKMRLPRRDGLAQRQPLA